MADKIRRWIALHPNWTLTLITLAALAPFLAKPFNIDDPLFIWVARQIHLHPANPYGFTVNWGQTAFPMWNVTENPPLACYYLAVAAAIFGWSEIGLHFAFVLPAIAAVLGTHRLARHFCNSPLLVALLTLFTPVFLISSTTVMCDVMMLAFWIWAVVFWVEGLAGENFRKLAVAGLLVALAEMTKYYAACLVPLLAAYSLAGRRPVKCWAQFLLTPLAVLCAYQYVTQAAYGSSLLYRAMDYASFSKTLSGFSKWNNGLIALAFTGGCMATSVFFLPLLWRRRAAGTLIAVTALVAASLFFNDALWKNYAAILGAARTSAKIQMMFWSSGGLCVLALAATDLWRRRDTRSLLLSLWVAGTFVFAAFCNWTVNGRSFLPLAPAMAILIVRRLEQNSMAGWKIKSFGVPVCLAVGAVMAFLAARADFLLASAARETAREVCADCQSAGRTLWFQGHWGFQYYMEALGASPLDIRKSPIKPGDNLAMPVNNTVFFRPNPRNTVLRGTLSVPGPQLLATMNQTTGAGFYASIWGPLPFAFGRVPPEIVSVYVLGIAAK